MLNIIYGDVKNSIYNTNVYFKNSYEPEWLEAELVKKIVLEEMEKVVPLRVPLIADCGEGQNWLEAH